MNTQPTPRTDANVKRHNLCRLSGNDLVYADFTRQLERELAVITEQRDKLAEALRNCLPFITGDGCGEYSDAREALQSLTPNAKP
jgi:hypothetical protein